MIQETEKEKFTLIYIQKQLQQVLNYRNRNVSLWIRIALFFTNSFLSLSEFLKENTCAGDKVRQRNTYY